MGDEQHPSPEEEGRHHTYETARIPWWLRGIWLGFWVFVAVYFVVNLIPSAKHYF